MKKIVIHVEGKADEKFIRDMWNKKENELVIFSSKRKDGAGGFDEICTRHTNIKSENNAGNTVAVIADANNNIDGRKEKLDKLRKETGVKFPYFLLPNDKDKGNLETLLFAMCKDKRPTECFTQYKKCIKDKKLHSPDKKAEIYAYCQMLSGAEKAKETERNYTDEKLWNLDTPKLQPLKKFLKEL